MFPIGEGLVGGVLLIGFNFATILFSYAVFEPIVGTNKKTAHKDRLFYCLLAIGIIFGISLILIYKINETLNRKNADDKNSQIISKIDTSMRRD